MSKKSSDLIYWVLTGLVSLIFRRESLTHIAAGGARAAGVVIALDRMERGTGAVSAVEEVRNQMGLPVVSIANLDDIVDYLSNDPGMAASLAAVEKYRALYGSR